MTTLAEVRAALETVRLNPIDANDRPQAWRALSALLDLLASLPADAVIVTPDSLAWAWHGLRNGRREPPCKVCRSEAVAILAALAAEGGPA